MAAGPLDRPRRGEGRVLVGVCVGLAQHYGFSPLLVRAVFLVLALVGAGEIAYLVLWLLMPRRR